MTITLEPVQRLSRDVRAASAGMTLDEARFLVDRYYQLQDNRIGTRNQERAAATVEQEPHAVLSYLGDQFEALEQQIKGALDKWTMAQPIGRWARSHKGVGPVICAGIISRVDITKAAHPSALWRYAGLAPGQRRVRGQLSDWNPELKRICWLLGESFVKVSGYEDAVYAALYVSRKAQEQTHNVNGHYAEQAARILSERKWTDGTVTKVALEQGRLSDAHIHARAKRYAVKRFLSDLWYEWRQLEGLPVTEPWVIKYGGH